MDELYFRVDVPISSSAGPAESGHHVLIGRAGSRAEALRLAREACEAALAARAAGLAAPLRRPDGWGVCGVRAGWRFDWAAASVVRWECDSLLGLQGRQAFPGPERAFTP